MVSRRLWVRAMWCVLIFGLGYIAAILLQFRNGSRKAFVEGFHKGVQRGRERAADEGHAELHSQ